MTAAVWDRQAAYSPDYMLQTHRLLMDALVRGWQGDEGLLLSVQSATDLSIRYGGDDWRVIQAMEANLFRFSAGKTLAVAADLNRALPQAKTYADYKKSIAGMTDGYNNAKLRTEYNFAWQTAQTSAEYQRMVTEAEVYPYWQYLTAGDNRVRPAHKALDRQVYKYDDPIWDQIYPPNGWGCRCYVKPLRDAGRLSTAADAHKALDVVIDSKGTTEWERMQADGMAINRADRAVVFSANQEYVRDLSASMGIKANGLPEYKDIDQSKLPEALIKDQTKADAMQWYQDHVKDGYMTDYAGRPLRLDIKNFENHLNKGKGDYKRYNLVENIPDILNEPDEVWYNTTGADKFNYRYIKWYKDNPMNVFATFDKEEGLTINSWYELNDKLVSAKGKPPIDTAMRTGLLIKKK